MTIRKQRRETWFTGNRNNLRKGITIMLELIKAAIAASTVEAGTQVNNCTWRDLTKKAWKAANEEDNDEVGDLLWEISKLRGEGVSLMLNANSLLKVAKRMAM